MTHIRFQEPPDIRVERYAFTVFQTLTMRKPCVVEISSYPTMGFLPNKMMANVPEPGMVIIDTFRVGEKVINSEPFDLFVHNFNLAWAQDVELPRAYPNTEFYFKGRYTGLQPRGIKRKKWWKIWEPVKFQLAVSFKGPA